MCLLLIILLIYCVVIECKELSFIVDELNLTDSLKVSQVISSVCSFKSQFRDGCYNKDILDDIPYIENRKQEFNEGSIFFIDTTCDGVLDWSKACSVEAAAISNPQRQIIVLFTGPVSTECINLAPTWEILKYTNVYIYRVNIDRYISDTPLLTLKTNLRFPMSRLGDIIKFITLYKFGGIYIHFDVMLVKSFDLLPEPRNWVGKADKNTLGECLALSKQGVGNLISQTMLRYYKYFFNATKWEMSDTETLTKVLQNVCHTTDVAQMSATLCGGFEVYDSYYFDPVKSDEYQDWRDFFALSYSKYPAEPFAFRLRTNIMTWKDVTPAQNLRLNHCPRIMHLSGNIE